MEGRCTSGMLITAPSTWNSQAITTTTAIMLLFGKSRGRKTKWWLYLLPRSSPNSRRRCWGYWGRAVELDHSSETGLPSQAHSRMTKVACVLPWEGFVQTRPSSGTRGWKELWLSNVVLALAASASPRELEELRCWDFIPGTWNWTPWE